MNRTEYGRIIAKNLKRIAYEHDKSQTEIAQDLGLKRVTVSSWMNGTRIPRIEKIDKLCQYFHVTRADIRTTANIYDHCDNESLMEAARLIST